MREQVRLVLDGLRQRGWRPRLVHTGGKHSRVEVEAFGEVLSVPIAWSPRDRHTSGMLTLRQMQRAIAGAEARASFGKAGRSA